MCACENIIKINRWHANVIRQTKSWSDVNQKICLKTIPRYNNNLESMCVREKERELK